ncbi:MAG TPA: hypothetical protein VFL42_12980, partial [Terriglobales bacterium]|nr:hypothetical protein [Terriglobales bacterium]
MNIDQRWALLGFPLAGLVSATLSLKSRYACFLDPLGSLEFGFLLAICFCVFFGVRSLSKALVFIFASTASAYLSIWSAVLVLGRLGDNPTYLPETFVGGYVGAFVILLTAVLLVAPDIELLLALVRSFSWALTGGLLAVIGRAAGPMFHDLRMQLDRGLPDSDFSLILVWKIGTAFVVALLILTLK